MNKTAPPAMGFLATFTDPLGLKDFKLNERFEKIQNDAAEVKNTVVRGVDRALTYMALAIGVVGVAYFGGRYVTGGGRPTRRYRSRR